MCSMLRCRSRVSTGQYLMDLSGWRSLNGIPCDQLFPPVWSRHRYTNFIVVDSACVGNQEIRCDTAADDHRGDDGNQMVIDVMSA